MTPQELFRSGRLQDAIQALGGELRNHPTDEKRRAFLFELLCFAGEWQRAEKQLNVLADATPEAGMGALVYRSAIAGERNRQVFFDNRQYAVPSDGPEPVAKPGRLNGEPFQTIEDADPRIGARLEIFLAGEYLWVPFAHLRSVSIDPPRLLRDLLWSSAAVMAGPELRGQDFGEILIPNLYPFSWRHARESVRLGRETDWVASDGGEVPYGQKLLVLDGERVIPFLEVRSLEFDSAGESEADDTAPGQA